MDPDGELGKALTETGALQVLFDTRLLRDFLVGGSTSKHTAPRSNSGQDHDFTELDVEFDGLEQSLQVKHIIELSSGISALHFGSSISNMRRFTPSCSEDKPHYFQKPPKGPKQHAVDSDKSPVSKAAVSDCLAELAYLCS